MDEFTAEAFANRDEPVPLLAVSASDIEPSGSEAETSDGRRSRLKNRLSGSRLRERAEAIQLERAGLSPETKLSFQDRLFSRILSQVIPNEDVDEEGYTPVDRRSSKYVSRPAFSLPLMTNNFRRFNARIGIIFVFQNRLIRLFTWRNPSHTLSFLATYTFICLDPYLLAALPLAVTLLFIMVPAFISRHPPPPPTNATSSTTPYYSTYSGPALAPARTIKPAAETSKDFFRNMRDLQNSMTDFSNLHDALVSVIAPATNFSDEILSSTIFLSLTIISLILFITAHLLPWRLIFLLAGYVMTISGHPRVQEYLVKHHSEFLPSISKDTKSKSKSTTPEKFPSIPNLPIPHHLHPLVTSLSTITLSSTPETREVEIFELQHRPLLPTSSSSTHEWTPHLFTTTPYDPLSPHRISGSRPVGTRFFEDVLPPQGWEWHSKKWSLDLDAAGWVTERLVVGVEYDAMNTDAANGDNGDQDEPQTTEFGGWVWDLPLPPGQASRDEEVWLAYGDYYASGTHSGGKGTKRKGPTKEKVKEKDWEETTRYGGGGRTGEWRRRRWVRLVRRKVSM